MTKVRYLLCLLTVFSVSCAQESISRTPSSTAAQGGVSPLVGRDDLAPVRRRFGDAGISPQDFTKGKIQHVVIIFQENRSTDNLFNGLPGADTAQTGETTSGGRVTLQPVPLTARYDLDHSHIGFETEFDSGAMDGFNLEDSTCSVAARKCGTKEYRAYGYVPHDETVPYFTMAEQYAFADRMFETNQGPSFPAHQYIISGTATISKDSTLRAAANALSPSQAVVGGCDSPPGSLALTISDAGQLKRFVYPCFDRVTLADLADQRSLSWRYYLHNRGPGLWNAFDAIKHIRDGAEYANVVSPNTQIYSDIDQGRLPNIAWLIPTAKASDHANTTDGSGPDWVASVVNAIGESQYWNNTVIFVTWDDWGGWYDHVKPPQYNVYELGFRVPLIAISAYTDQGYISHRQHEFGSILKFTEKTFGLGSLGTTDVRADDLSDCFHFSRTPRAFQVIPTTLKADYFLKRPPSNEPPDDE